MDYTRLGFFGTVGAIAALVVAPEITIPVALGGALVGGGVDVIAQASDASVTAANGDSYTSLTPWPTTTQLDANGNPVTVTSGGQILVIAAAVEVVGYLVFRR